MSTIDSVFNSLATLFSIDIYKGYINPNATDQEVVAVGRRTILVGLVTGVLMALLLIHYKFNQMENAFTHTLNDLRNTFNIGFVVLICIAGLLTLPKQKAAILGFLITVPINLGLRFLFPEMNYLIRAFIVISTAFLLVAVPNILKYGFRTPHSLVEFGGKDIKWFGWGLLISLVLTHIIWH